MPRLAERAAETLGHLPPKAVEVLAGTGFAAAGVVAVVAENLKTLSDRDEPLPERAKKVGATSLGAILSPATLPQRGRELVGRDGRRAGDGDGQRGSTTSPRPTEAGGADTSATAAPDDQAVPPRGIDTSSADAAPSTSKPASRKQDEEPGAGREQAEAAKQHAERAAREAADNVKSGTDRAVDRVEEATDQAAETTKRTVAKAADTTKSVADRTADRTEKATSEPATKPARKPATSEQRPSGRSSTERRSPAEKRAAEKAARKSTSGSDGQQAEAATPDVPAGVDEGLVRDLQRMTVKQLRDRAAQDGIAGRSGMSKDELITALATRETDETPAKK